MVTILRADSARVFTPTPTGLSERRHLRAAPHEAARTGAYGPGWTTYTLPTGHEAMLTMPREVAALLGAAAGV